MRIYFAIPLLIALAVSACGGGKSAQSKPAESSTIVTNAAKAALNILIPKAIADQAPLGSIYMVKLILKGGKSYTIVNLPYGRTTASFSAINFGTYDIEITAEDRGIIIAKGAATIIIDKTQNSIEVPMGYSKGSLLVEPIMVPQLPTQDMLGGTYQATARTEGCFAKGFSEYNVITAATAIIDIPSGAIDITLDTFPRKTIKINATFGLGEKFVNGIGTFESSDRMQGAAEIDKILQLEDSSIFMSIMLKGECNLSLDLTGFKI